MAPQPRARFCKLRKWPDYVGYGFSLQATKGKVGHFISDVDEDSPAHAAGLRDGDFVVEVNGSNILTEMHADVVQRIKSNPDGVTFLLLDVEARRHFDARSIAVHGAMSEIETIVCPSTNPYTKNRTNDAHCSHKTGSAEKRDSGPNDSVSATRSVTNGAPPQHRNSSDHRKVLIAGDSRDSNTSVSPASSMKNDPAVEISQSKSITASPTPKITPSSEQATHSSPISGQPNFLNSNISANEMRVRVGKNLQRHRVKESDKSFGARAALFDQM